MESLFLNIGCGEKKIPGFVNIDIEAGADMQVDVSHGLPFGDNSVNGIFSEHFIEHLSQADGVAFLRECRRVLRPDGILRLATPDLDELAEKFTSDWSGQAWLHDFGYQWIDNRCEMLNIAMREWGHKWLYNGEELARLAGYAGMTSLKRCKLGESDHPKFRGLEYREDSKLIIEFVKYRADIEKETLPLVSILIAAYNPKYFRDALESALKQTYSNIEIIVSDDCPNDDIKKITSEYSSTNRQIVYLRNNPPLKAFNNYLQCFDMAQGDYIKFLNDDDMFHPTCVERMVNCLGQWPDVTLVTSHRQRIDAKGKDLPDCPATRRPVKEDCIINGTSLANVLLAGRINFIGEPSTAMFRKKDISGTKPHLLSFAGREVRWNVDVAIWLTLLGKGEAIYLTETLSYFRQHPEQEQKQQGANQKAIAAWEQMLFDAKRMGFLSTHGPRSLVARPLNDQGTDPQEHNNSATNKPKQKKALSVSIIIPVFNKVEYTIKCCEAIAGNTSNELYEIIIVDNASTDGTKDFLQSIECDVKTITNKENLGFAKACNQGAEAASSDYLLFLNNDTEAEESWLEPLLEVLDKDDSVAAVGSKLLFPDGTIQHAGVVVVEDKKLPDPLVARHIYYREEAEFSEANEMRTYQALTAASLLIRKSAFEEAGRFDEAYWNGYEDVDLCFKLQGKGYKIVYQPRSVLIHHESVSGPERFVKVSSNTTRLHNRWLGRIKADLIIEEDGTVKDTDACMVKSYSLPAGPAGETHRLPENQCGLTSIVILTFNQLKYTKECVESIKKHTQEPHEIIFVDNGSRDGTTKWLKQLCEENDNYILIENRKNLGFAAGCNQGIKASRGEYILLLNNDVVVTKDWLSGMLECIKSSDNTGIAGPMTNSISGPQKVEDVGYNSVKLLDDYAASFRQEHRHRWIAARRVVGFCMLFRRELAGVIGLLDEDFGSGNFEDDDYCLRAALEGYRNIIAGDVFIHHYGSASFKGNNINYALAMAANNKIFTKKWSGIDERTALGKKLLLLNTIDGAEILNRQGEVAKAVKTLVDAIKKFPKEKALFYILADILIDAKQYREALEMIEKIYEDEPEPRKLTLLGQCHAGMDNPDKAEEYVERALMINPAFAPALNLKGVIEYNNRDKPAAETSLKRSIESDPSFGEAYKNLGVLRLKCNRRKEAIDLFEKAFMLNPASTDIVTTYHIAITETGEFGRCEKKLREAMHFFPLDKRMTFLLIDVLLKQGKDEAAMREIEGAMLNFGIDEGILSAAIEVRERLDAEKSIKKEKKPSLSLCMIVKNEEKYLAKCLASILPIADEMIVVDTGSVDMTKDIARAFGAKVFDLEWTEDFSEARNYSLSEAKGDWILILDADEAISPLDHAAITKIVRKKCARTAAYSIETRNYVRPSNIAGWTANDGGYSAEEAGSGWFPGSKVRLFTNDSSIQFENPVHELVEPSLKKLGIKIKKCPVPVHHYGKLDMDKNASKGEEYYLMGKKKLDQMGGNVLAIRELAIQAGELGKYDDAVELWESVIKIKPHMDDAYLNLGHTYLELGRYKKALIASKKAVKAAPQMKEALLNYSMSELYAGDIKKTVFTLEKLIVKYPDYPSARLLLAVAYCSDGKNEKGLELLGTFTKEGINISGAISCYREKLIAAGKSDYADKLRNAAAECNNTDKDILHAFSEYAGRGNTGNEFRQMKAIRKQGRQTWARG